MWTPNEDAERLQRGGRGAYRNKEFELAMKLFSQALEVPGISASLQLHVLDNRAATQEKLGGADALRAALADAKKMIQLQKTGVNGYLRAGKILQLQGNDKLALDLYKYGLKRIAPNDDDGREVSVETQDFNIRADKCLVAPPGNVSKSSQSNRGAKSR